MRTFWGAATEIQDLGVVAEQCPYCNRLACCLLRSVCLVNYAFFAKMAELPQESSCMCTDCLKTFPGKEPWRYAAVVPIREARKMQLNDLLVQTNPVLADRIQFKEQIRDLGGDDRFATAYEHVEGLRPGPLRSDLLHKLLDWLQLPEPRQAELGRQIGALARAWPFTRQRALGFPGSAGRLAYVVAAIVVGLLLLRVPETRNWLGGTMTVVAALIAAAIADSILLKQAVRRWTRAVLIPEAQEADVSLDCFVDLVDDVPGSRLGLTEELWPLKDQLQTIRETLVAEGKLPSSTTQEAFDCCEST